MRDHLDDLGDASVAVVTFADPNRLEEHRAELGLPFPVLADVDRVLYRRFELGSGRLAKLYGPATIRRYVELVRRGRRLRMPGEDTRQLGGDVVIDRDGRLAARWRQSSPADRPPVDDLVAAVRAAR